MNAITETLTPWDEEAAGGDEAESAVVGVGGNSNFEGDSGWDCVSPALLLAPCEASPEAGGAARAGAEAWRRGTRKRKTPEQSEALWRAACTKVTFKREEYEALAQETGLGAKAVQQFIHNMHKRGEFRVGGRKLCLPAEIAAEVERRSLSRKNSRLRGEKPTGPSVPPKARWKAARTAPREPLGPLSGNVAALDCPSQQGGGPALLRPTPLRPTMFEAPTPLRGMPDLLTGDESHEEIFVQLSDFLEDNAGDVATL